MSQLPENCYEVQRILNHREDGARREYLIQWTHYPGEDTWEPLANLEAITEMVEIYDSQLPATKTRSKKQNIKNTVEKKQETIEIDSSSRELKRVKKFGLAESDQVQQKPTKKVKMEQLKPQNIQDISLPKSKLQLKKPKHSTLNTKPQPLMKMQLDIPKYDIGEGNTLGAFNYLFMNQNELLMDVDVMNCEGYLLTTAAIKLKQLEITHTNQLQAFLKSQIEIRSRSGKNL